jgi:hypothetical protein
MRQSTKVQERGVKLMSTKHSTIFGVLIILYFLLKPFYLWNSGLPQIADFVILLLVIYTLFLGGGLYKEKDQEQNFTFILCLGFLFYVIAINSVWTMVLGDTMDLMISTFFYIYNMLILICCILIYNKLNDDIYKYFYYGIFATVIIQVILFVVMDSIHPTRASNFFNNPNQLGYFALLNLGILFIIERKINYRPIFFLISVLSCFLLILVSVSKAALISSIMMYVVFAIVSKRGGAFKIINISLVGILGSFFALIATNQPFLYNINTTLDSILYRIHDSSTGGSYLEGRGYDRIFNHTNYWIFGSGEGHESRFTSMLAAELHSTLGNIFFSYGLIGFILFMLIVFYVFYKSKLIYAYPLVCMFFYGLTHNGIRNSALWMMIAILIVSSEKITKNKAEKKLQMEYDG